MPDSFEIGPKFYCHGRTPHQQNFRFYFRIRKSLWLLPHYYLDIVSVKSARDWADRHTQSSAGGSIQFNLDEAHFNILGE